MARWTKTRIRELRESRGLSQTAFGEAVGLSLRMVQYLETGERKPSRLQCNALNYIESREGSE